MKTLIQRQDFPQYIGSPVIVKECREFVSDYNEQVLHLLRTEQDLNGISTINSDINRGIIFACNSFKMSNPGWLTLLFLTADRLMQGDYVLDHAYQEEDDKTIRYSIYMKPSLRLRAQIPVKQLFGNVFLEVRLNGGLTRQWKLLTNVYMGRTYQKPLPLEDLITSVWQNGKNL